MILRFGCWALVIQGLGFRLVSGFGVRGVGRFRVWGLGFRVGGM